MGILFVVVFLHLCRNETVAEFCNYPMISCRILHQISASARTLWGVMGWMFRDGCSGCSGCSGCNGCNWIFSLTPFPSYGVSRCSGWSGCSGCNLMFSLTLSVSRCNGCKDVMDVRM